MFVFALQLIRLTLPGSTSNRGKECSSSTVLVFLCVRGVAGSLCVLLMTVMPARCHFPDPRADTAVGNDWRPTEAGVTSFASGVSQSTAAVLLYIHHRALKP